ncbi:DinB family protein [bacterium]|nr:DinB family protein [bacterium]
MKVAETVQLREQLIGLLEGGQAHAEFDAAVADMPPGLRGRVIDGAGYSPWQLLEHMRIAQWDILEFSRNPRHVSPKWPEGYWPPDPAPPGAQAWDESIGRFRADLEAMKELVNDPENDLNKPFQHGQGQTLLREALLAADHNAYHLGQFVLLRKIMGAWPEK